MRVEVVGYNGEGVAVVRPVTGGPTVEAGTEQTYKPGSEVLVARLFEGGELAIVAGPGPESAGASALPADVSRAPAPVAGPATPEGAWFAYVVDDTAGSEHVDGWTYDDAGAVAVELNTWTPGFKISAPGGGNDGLVLPASRTLPILCGAKLDGSGGLIGVWVADLTDGSGWVHDTPAGWKTSAPIPYLGRIYWMEAEVAPAGNPTVKLFSAAASTEAQTATEESSTALSAPWGGGTLDRIASEGRVGTSLGVGFIPDVGSQTGATSALPSGAPVEIGNQLAQDRCETSFDGTGWQYAPVFGDIERIDQTNRDAGTFTFETVGDNWGSLFHVWMDVVGSSLWVLDDLGALHRGTESSPESSPLETITLTDHPTHGAATIVHKIS